MMHVFHMIKSIIYFVDLSIPVSVSDLTFGDVIGRGNLAVRRKCVWNGTSVAVKTIGVPTENTGYVAQEIKVLM